MATYQIKYRDGSERHVEGNDLVLREYMAEIVDAARKTVALVARDLIQDIIVVEDEE